MRIAVLIPDRGDRPKLLQNCLRMMAAQTLKPDHIEIVNDPPFSGKKDITWRYRTGYDRLRNRGFDVIALIENDDWYHPEYLETMVHQWQLFGKPELFGTDYTIYYHIRLMAWFTMHHPARSSAMNSLIVPDLAIRWPRDHDPYTDIHLWQQLSGKNWHPPMICMGIKHEQGLHGGRNHTDRLDRYINHDSNHQFIRKHMDAESYAFYSAYYGNTKDSACSTAARLLNSSNG